MCDCANGYHPGENDKTVCEDDASVCKDADKTSADCTCNKTTGKWENCECKQADLPDYATKCECDSQTGQWKTDTCQYRCDPANKPPHSTTCECSDENEWICAFEDCVDNGDKNSTTCRCPYGEWIECDYCKGKTLLSGQACDSETGRVYYSEKPHLIVTPAATTIVEGGGSSEIKVRLSAEPEQNVTLNVSRRGDDVNRRFRISPINAVISASGWEEGATFVVRSETNEILEGTEVMELTFETASDAGDFDRLSAKAQVTSLDDDEANASIVLTCDNDVIATRDCTVCSDGCSSGSDILYAGNGENMSIKCTISVTKKSSIDIPIKLKWEGNGSFQLASDKGLTHRVDDNDPLIVNSDKPYAMNYYLMLPKCSEFANGGQIQNYTLTAYAVDPQSTHHDYVGKSASVTIKVKPFSYMFVRGGKILHRVCVKPL